jgi:hypothetical protein
MAHKRNLQIFNSTQSKPNPKPMSNYTPQPNTFTLFANDKGDNPKRPDYRGDIILPDGTKMRLSAWVKEGQSGKKFLSGKVVQPTLLNHRLTICRFSVNLYPIYIY